MCLSLCLGKGIISLYTLPRLLFDSSRLLFDSSPIIKITFDELRRKIINLKYYLDHNGCYHDNGSDNKFYDLKNAKIKHIYHGKYDNWWTIRSYYGKTVYFNNI